MRLGKIKTNNNFQTKSHILKMSNLNIKYFFLLENKQANS